MAKQIDPKSQWRRLFPLVRIAVPAAILVFIFSEVEWRRLWETVTGTHPLVALLSVSCSPLLVEIGAFRWLLTLRSYGCSEPQTRFLRRHYWIGLAIGFFLPASVGWDAYRAAVCTRRHGRLVVNVLVILCEKMLALLTCLLVVGSVLPVLDFGDFGEIEVLRRASWVAMGATAMAIASFVLLRKSRRARALIDCSDRIVNSLVQNACRKFGRKRIFPGEVSFRSFAKPLQNWQFLVGAVVASVLIQVVTAIRLYLVFLAMGVDVPFLVHLFVGPSMTFIFMLPISFGSLGIREGAFVFLYGLFGVPMEAALVASFIGLAGLLLNNAIGGFVMMFSKWDRVLVGKGADDLAVRGIPRGPESCGQDKKL